MDASNKTEPGTSKPTARADAAALPLNDSSGVPSGDDVPALARASLLALAAIMSGDESIETWTPILLAALEARYGSKPATARKVFAEANRLLRYLRARGAVTLTDIVEDLITEWCWAARPDRTGRHRSASPATARNRRWAARAVLETAAMLGAPVDAASAGEHSADRGQQVSARPLTPDEEHAVRTHAESTALTLRVPLAAFAFAGGTAREIAALTAADIDLNAGTIRLGGDSARTNALDDWSCRIVGMYLRNARFSPHDPLCVNERLSPVRAAHSVTVRLRRVIVDAGLRGRPGVVAGSLRLTAARRILGESGLEAAARFLGSRSLNGVAEALEYDWRDGHG